MAILSDNNELKEVLSEDEQIEFEKRINRPSDYLIKELLTTNDISTLVLTGVLSTTKGPNNELLGFFRDVTSIQNKKLYYPNGQQIDNIFIFNPSSLEEGKWYYFECDIAGKEVRIERKNPHLLKTSVRKVEQGERLNPIVLSIKEKQKELEELDKFIVDEERNADEIIYKLEATIAQKQAEVAENDSVLLGLRGNIEESLKNLSEVESKKTDMENKIESLKHRVSLCKSLDFLSEKDERLYFDMLSGNQFNYSSHFNFGTDLDENFSILVDHIHHYLYHKKNLIYTRFQIKNFLTLLRSHDLVVLSGLSGSGKTQIVKAFAEALGGVAKIIPVKPNWTSSDDLIGYYNPIQMSFLPTPFTEAIVEATQNPHQLYFICLDEMNLARVEYYFADFLSKLEERTTEPEIELYAKHEEELFISEFNTLLDIIEGSIKGSEIKSWQNFLDNKEARTDFIEMLGNVDKESLLQLHSRMKRRLIDVLKFPATIRVPNNVRFVGAINVDETTHYFSPKILDRVHIVKFDNPLIYEDSVHLFFEKKVYERDLRPIYVSPDLFSKRSEYPKMNQPDHIGITSLLKEINLKFLLPLNIDFGVRSIRQSLNYARFNQDVFEYSYYHEGNYEEPDIRPYTNTNAESYMGDMSLDNIVINTILAQKVFPRFLFDGNEISKNGKSKLEILKEMHNYLEDTFGDLYDYYQTNEFEIGKSSTDVLSEILRQAENNPQINFFA